MLDLHGYDVKERLYAGARSWVWRCERRADRRAVVVKVLDDEAPTPHDLARARWEVEVGQRVAGPFAIQYFGLERCGAGMAIVMEDFGGVSLASLVPPRGFDLVRFLDLAIAITDRLARIHKAGFIHREIKPANILVVPTDWSVRICDFEFAVAVDDPLGRVDAGSFEGTLAYIAPEQTGRVSHPVDQRSDLYALGITLHELLTGELPFTAEDPLELVHAHLAQRPPSVTARRPDVPAPIAEIILELLSKSPGDRYESARGLLRDLERCRDELARAGTIAPFPLGRHDSSGRLHLADAFQGRKEETERLLHAFEGAAVGAASLVLVRGRSGVGKSALIQRLQRPILERRAAFCAGKFDELGRDVPYSAVIGAVRGLLRQLLTETEAAVDAWRARILGAVGPNGRILVDVIPELERIIGPQPAPVALGPLEAQARFRWASTAFIAALASERHPLVLFLDDLQWADDASLSLLEAIFTEGRARYLFVVGAYRDNEVDAGHRLLFARRAIEAVQPVDEIALGPLGREDVLALVAEVLHLQAEEIEVEELASLLHARTKGNPFFLRELLETLHRRGLLAFDEERGRWSWDLGRIEQSGVTDDVVELMISEIRALGEDAQRALSLAACVGSRFDLGTLAVVAEAEPEAVASRLGEALRRGLVLAEAAPLRVGGPDHDGAGEAGPPPAEVAYRFLHDRVQEAAYALIAPEERPAIHRTIGRVLGRTDGRSLFEIVGHLNRGASLLHDPAERLELAQRNHAAGERAQASNAYAAALAYQRQAFALLGPDAWRRHYALALAVQVRRAEAAHLAGDGGEREQVVADMLANARELLDRIPAYRLRFLGHTARDEMAAALASAIEVLRLLDVHLPSAPSKSKILLGLARTKWLLRGKDREALLALPPMTDPRALAAMRILSSAVQPAFLASPEMFPLLVFELLRLSVTHGVTGPSVHGFGGYAVMLAGVLGDLPGADVVSDVALRLEGRLGAADFQSKALCVRGVFIVPWTGHLRDSLDVLLAGYRAGVDHGDNEHAALNLVTYCYHLVFAGVPLDEAGAAVAQYHDAVKRCGFAHCTADMRRVGQFIRNLRGEAADPARLAGPGYDEDEDLRAQVSAKVGNAVGTIAYLQAFLAFTRGDFERAHERCRASAEHIGEHVGTYFLPAFHLLFALTRLAMHDTLGPIDRRTSLLGVEQSLRKLRGWAERAPMNFQHQVHLVEAERARVLGRRAEAMEHYELAVARARQNRFVQDEALANELAGRFYLSLGRAALGREHLVEARRCYAAWGGGLAVARLDAAFPDLATSRSRAADAGTSVSVTRSASAPTAIFDLATVLQASHAIAEEIILDALLRKLVRMLIQNAGAERGVLLVATEGRLAIEVEGAPLDADVVMHRGAPVEGSDRLPASIINYVARTGESVVLHDARAEGLFTGDPYVAARGTRSVLCAPLQNQGKLIAVVYLENDLNAGTFTPERLEVLRLLSAQAALSIHNARLYANLERSTERLAEYSRTLEEKVDARTRELSDKNAELGVTLEKLRATQRQLVTQEKLASLGALTAGIAHEIKNPLNFVTNFAELTAGLAAELGDGASASRDDLEDTVALIRQNVEKIGEHGKRANAIVDSMLLHARSTTDTREEADLNALLASSATLASEAARNKAPGLSVEIRADYDASLGSIPMYAADLNRVFVNLIDNACYALRQRARGAEPGYAPVVSLRTRDRGQEVEVRIRDNGTGIPDDVVGKIYNPFFTTKPTGEGTGLGLSISHDIVVDRHHGAIRVDTVPGDFTEFVITLPKQARL